MIFSSVLKNMSRKLFTRSFRARKSTIRKTNTLRTRLGFETFEDRIVPAIDVTGAGAIGFSADFNVRVEHNSPPPTAGTGVINPFYRIHDTGRTADNFEEGYNTDARPGSINTPGAVTADFLDDIISAQNFTYAITLGDVKVVNIGGVDYREFRLDLGEPGGDLAEINFSQLQLFASTSRFEYGHAGATLGAATLIYNMDAVADNDFTLKDTGSGQGSTDYAVFIANRVFIEAGTRETDYLYLYSGFGNPPPTADGAFEEWSFVSSGGGNPSAPSINVDKTASVASVSEGGVGNQSVTYTYVVTNTSTETGVTPFGAGVPSDPLSGVTLADTDGTPTLFSKTGGDQDNLLENGETWTYTLIVPLAAANAGASHTNTATASGTDDENNTVSDTDTATVTYTNVAPSINVVKTANPTTVPEGPSSHSITYSYAVTNTSAAGAFDPLSGVALSDTDGTPSYVSGDAGVIGALEVGETWLYSLTISLAGANAGTVHGNTATASGTDDEGNTATATGKATVTYTNVAPAINVVKTANVGVIAPGSTVIFTYMVTNTSPAGVFDPLSGIILSDTDGTPIYSSGDVGADGILTVGETWTYSLTVTNVQPNYNSLDIHHNTVTATGKDDENNTATNTAEASVLVLELGNGRTIGFWGNKNGAAVLTGAGQVGWVAQLNSLNLRNSNGTDFVLSGTNPQASSALATWLSNANATNMQYMLSAQLAATWLNTHVDMDFATAGVQVGVDPASAVYLPAIYSWGANTQGANLKKNLYGTGTSPLSAGESFSNSGNSFVLLSDVMSDANKILGNYGTILSTTATNLLYRLHAEALKNVCDAVNNSYAGNTAGPGAILVSNATYQYLVVNGHWVDSNGNGLVDAGEVQP